MSPEQIEGKEADARADIFAFGAVLYEMAIGKRAFEGKSPDQRRLRPSSKKTPTLSARPSLPRRQPFDYLVAACLAKDREDRFQSAPRRPPAAERYHAIPRTPVARSTGPTPAAHRPTGAPGCRLCFTCRRRNPLLSCRTADSPTLPSAPTSRRRPALPSVPPVLTQAQ